MDGRFHPAKALFMLGFRFVLASHGLRLPRFISGPRLELGRCTRQSGRPPPMALGIGSSQADWPPRFGDRVGGIRHMHG